MNRRMLVAIGIAAALISLEATLANAGIVNINPSKDNTLYEYDPLDGDRSNALGFHFFAGETGMNELRRGVLAFDIAGSVPPGSTITAVSLSVNMSRTPTSTVYVMELHKLLADWGEGTSVAPGEEGDGAPATPNDATWRHRFFDTIGEETAIATAKRFDTRESASPPMLTIEFIGAPRMTPSPRPRPTPAPRP